MFMERGAARGSLILILAALSTGCAFSGLILAPGADQVKFTSNPADVAGSRIPANPSVELSKKRPRSVPAARNFPCKASLIITVGVSRLAKKLLTPVRIGEGTTCT